MHASLYVVGLLVFSYSAISKYQKREALSTSLTLNELNITVYCKMIIIFILSLEDTPSTIVFCRNFLKLLNEGHI